MGKTELGFEEFIAAVDEANAGFVTELHQCFTDAGCKIGVKEAKSGYVVSYVLGKKTIANFVFRKKGIIIRIYANHIVNYMELLESLPEGMLKEIKRAPDCKRLLNPDACNPKCATGYDFLLQGDRLQKCRYSAFMFLLCNENNPFIKDLLQKELAACS